MKGRKPASQNVVPLKDDVDRGDFEEYARSRAKELKPRGMPQDVQRVWDAIAPPLSHPTRNRLNEVTAFMLSQLCFAIARHQELRKDLAENGETYVTETRNGKQEKSRPEVAQLNETFRQIRGLANEFGMTPAAERGLNNQNQMAFNFPGEDDFT